ncbi:PAS-domain containing protein [Sulfitobacter geojensis]|uniref:histidine kinase n=2 Tax=Sulfitobacter geojensis TaxID=1342299 RepID=A0AAE3B7E4_9RHOB|nr:PAS-domain containing protein [Sulfitobacter geojensis]MBM1694772.1 PAS-domain containing protein [Sulfitobacter geojensis]MBM1707073.1 PAS-domain containing protein [Sulfitobacter geojensis]MBM1711132.1 PAS-domain containing protein [Sulfitobacter geojensis]MBM1715198.1 PAS-domain containing protein [Sulfitobacter geojensis]
MSRIKRTSIGGTGALVVVLLAFLMILITVYRVDRLLYSSHVQKVRSDTKLELLEVRENFEEIIHSQSLALRELSTFIGENPNIDQDEFSARVLNIRGMDDSVISIAAAPDMVITLIHPLKENQGALGLDYRNNEEQFPTIEKMLLTGSEMITGPVNLVQGGSGLILRAPVYLPIHDDMIEGDTIVPNRNFWGVVSLVLNYDEFLVKSGIADAALHFDLFIDIAERTEKQSGSFFYGDRSLLSKDPVSLQFDFAFEDWILHAVTKGGWPKQYPDQWWQRMIMALAGITMLGTILYILWLSETRKRAELILNRGIAALNDGFVMFDANDRLIVSNEKYREIYGFSDEILRPGTHLSYFLEAGAKIQRYPLDSSEEKAWMEQRVKSYRANETVETEQVLASGRVIKVSDHLLDDGSYVGLRVDVTELSRARIAAESANKAKTDFMGLLSHELRTPLTVILGVAKLSKNARLLSASKTLLAAYEDGSATPEEAKRMLDDVFTQLAGLMDRMVQSGEHLLHLINEMLDIAKIESGSLTIDPELCDIKDIVDPVIEQLSTLSRDKMLDFEVVQESGRVFADRVRARQILFNLIGNAIKFTNTGFVRLVIKVEVDVVRFEVHDSGSGIPEEEFESIFDVFYQVDSTATRNAGGTGMGLAISRSLAGLQNGSLTVSSDLGRGSCFVLSLPTSSAALRDTKSILTTDTAA